MGATDPVAFSRLQVSTNQADGLPGLRRNQFQEKNEKIKQSTWKNARTPVFMRLFWLSLQKLASGCLIAAMRLFQYRIAQAIEDRQKYWLLVIGVAVVALCVFVIHRWDKSLNPS
jgi:hypothetical protein